ncbi:MAG: hypothetical protein P0Y56_13085 [Candidatus Andeanibacterium colombiense]|uniref:DUF6644 domain-containing protein n=1 Tax=Candidatus Andeanibacterium colombiense TaxID=3121345 RepID=A0AAJ6BM22_9SPHN|nr:MAG: hypothetical protein P0Y56_13085 [Sphingomonadaceae bacterium]
MTDLLFEFTEWIRTTFLVDFSLWISDTWLSMLIVTHFWAIPAIQTVHILTIAASFGAVLLMNLRVLGVVGTDRTIARTGKRYLPWLWYGFVILIITGLGMITAEPVRELINPIFWIKMGLFLVAVIAAAWFQIAVSRKSVNWDAAGSASFGIKLGAVGIILLWLVIMLCGRWIAYAPT